MIKTKKEIDKVVKEITDKIDFSGVVLMKDEGEVFLDSAFGHANRAEKLPNTVQTRFGIASGSKLFTAIGICQLVEKGMVSFDTKLIDCLDIHFPNFHKDITIHHLLTHSSGIPDYFDESVMDNFEDLWKQTPMYLLKTLSDFLPLFQDDRMMFTPGEKFHYNNAGFIVLGLIIEKQTGLEFTEYIEKYIFKEINMKDSGYFSFDNLPQNTAFGYIEDKGNQSWKTNMYSLPIKGGADGGAFVTAQDMMNLWEGLFDHKLLSKKYTDILLTPHILVKENHSYGYGIWIETRNKDVFKYHVMGYDPGVSFRSTVYPKSGIELVIISNKGFGPEKMIKGLEEIL
ncbi:serine hydrolase domain-containing protein [Bacillus gaemokensis]|uniref:Penicillin-binding protein n=1 Tax=Bacillus gaemokensis TaxID=574375 RepID=A0A073KAJ8_9BACI|nr:serine hydrolase [Bacillus gaemokensis]KEK23452.1 penicillin-binding protein [Bacillus gaemokensis]KYG25808.1 penicillin-binding protein [Bacillus gaemokensis]